MLENIYVSRKTRRNTQEVRMALMERKIDESDIFAKQKTFNKFRIVKIKLGKNIQDFCIRKRLYSLVFYFAILTYFTKGFTY